MKKCLMACSVLIAGLGCFAEQFTLTIGGDDVTCAPAGGTYESGASVSISAGEGFVKWLGDVPTGIESNATIAVMMDADKTIVPVYDGMWVLERTPGSTTKGTITEVSLPREGHVNWKLKVGEIGNEYQAITIGEGWATAFIYENNVPVGAGKLDLSKKIIDETGNEWRITFLKSAALTGDKNLQQPNLTEVILPSTATKTGEQILNVPGGNTLTNVVMDCPGIRGPLTGGLYFNGNNLDYMTLKLPGITKIPQNYMNGPKLRHTDVSDWDLSALKELPGQKGTDGGGWVNYGQSGFFAGKMCTGVLRLPSIEHVGTNVFIGTQLSEVYLGTLKNRSVKKISFESFVHLWNIRSDRVTWYQSTKIALRKLVVSGEPGWILEPNALSIDNGLSQIVFLGGLPQRLGADESWFMNPDTAEKTVCFYVNEHDAESAGILSEARSLTDGEADAFLAANPGAPIPVGVVGPEVFGTEYAQFVGKVDLSEYGFAGDGIIKAGVHDSRYGDSVAVEIAGGKSVAEVAPGDHVTLRAVLNEGNRIGYWTGLPDGAVEDGDAVTFTMTDRPVDVCLYVEHMWRFLPAGSAENPTTTNRVTDGIWLLNVIDALDTKNKKITIGKSGGNGSAYTGVGNGILNLNGPVNKDGDTDWVIGNIAQTAFKSYDNLPVATNVITELIAPRMMNMNGREIVYNLSTRGPSVLTNVVLYLPEMSNTFGDSTFRGQRILENIDLYAPKAKAFGGNIFANCDRLMKDVGEWRLDSVGEINSLGLSSFSNLHGDFRLQSLTNVISANAFQNIKISSLELGTRYEPKDGITLKLPDRCFGANKGCTALQRLVFGPYAAAVFANETFMGLNGLREIVFEDRPFARSEMDKLLTGNSSSNGAQDWAVVIYGSPLRGWTCENLGLTAFDDLASADRAKLPAGIDPGLVTGLYTTATGNKHAWVVRRASEWDPKGTVLIVR